MISVSPARAASGTATTRALVGCSTLAVEYLFLAVAFDGVAIAASQAWWAALGRIGALVSISVAVFTAGLLLRGGELLARLKEATRSLGPIEPSWAVLHVAVFAGFTAVTALLFGGRVNSAYAVGAALAAWLIAGTASLATLFRATFGSAWREIGRAFFGLLAAGFALGVFAWIAGLKTVPLWEWLASGTLQMSAWMLTPFVGSIRVVPEEFLLGIGDFEVAVEAPCSGMENIGAVSVFLLGYFYAFRERLRFPRSLLLVPLALVAVWLVNSARIAALVAVGAYVSPEIALGGFHSKAGWLALCVVALGVVVATRNSPKFSRAAAPSTKLTESATAVYLLPLLAFVGMGLLTGLFSSGVDWLYPIPVLAGGAVAWRYRREYSELVRGASLLWGLLVGVIAFGLWILLVGDPDSEAFEKQQQSLAEVDPWLRRTWLAFRAAGAVVVVPFIEELAFRGYLQRRLISEDFTAVPQNKFTGLSLGVSALAFGLLHASWLAGAAAGAAYSVACYRRGRLGDAVVAHATTNALLVTAALVFGHHGLWY